MVVEWACSFVAVVGFAGVKPLNITFTMARPLPIYPLKVPSYLFMPEARSRLSRRDAELIGSKDGPWWPLWSVRLSDTI